MLTYFASGTRPSMRDLGLYHAAARAQRVLLRADSVGSMNPPTAREFVRGARETNFEFLQRLRTGEADAACSLGVDGVSASPTLALLLRANLAVAEGSQLYALFREQAQPNLRAAELLK